MAIWQRQADGCRVVPEKNEELRAAFNPRLIICPEVVPTTLSDPDSTSKEKNNAPESPPMLTFRLMRTFPRMFGATNFLKEFASAGENSSADFHPISMAFDGVLHMRRSQSDASPMGSTKRTPGKNPALRAQSETKELQSAMIALRDSKKSDRW